jgi:pilus assembly protein CpaD
VTLFYDSVVAVGPECGDWSEDVNRSPQLKPAPIFGCASRRNLAHMVAEPTDLLIPQSETPRQSDRRTTTYKEYVTHKPEAGGGAGGQKSGP